MADPAAQHGANLTDPQRRLRDLLWLHPGTTDANTAAALAGLPGDETTCILEGLVTAGVLRRVYVVHDPGRRHGRDAGAMDASEREAFGRLVEELLTVGSAAQRAILPDREYLGPHLRQPPAVEFNEDNAIAWMETKLPALVAVQKIAYDLAMYAEAWEIAEMTWGLFNRRKRPASWAAIYGLGRQAAAELGDRRAHARMLIGLAQLFMHLEEPENAAQDAREALRLEREGGHRLGEATALESLGVAALALGQLNEAWTRFTAARTIHEELGRPRGVALMTRHLGEVALATGNIRQAGELLTTALHYFATVAPERYQEGRTLLFLARVHIAEDNLPGAELALNTVLDISHQAGTYQEEARARRALAEIADLQHAPGRAHHHRDIADGIEADLELDRALAGGSSW